MNGYWNGALLFGEDHMVITEIKVNKTANIVLTKKSEHVLCKLLTTRRPSATTSGSAEKLELIETRCATFLAASEPEPIAIEQSATFRAKMSLTPSPVIATTWPASLSDSMIVCFCSGETRPKTT